MRVLTSPEASARDWMQIALALVLLTGVYSPLATVVVGGLVTSTLLTLLVLPALYKWFSARPERAMTEAESA